MECFVTVGPGSGYALRVGAMSVLERTLRTEHKLRGVRRAQVAAEPIELRADLPVEVTWVPRATTPPDGITVVRGDAVGSVTVTGKESRRAVEEQILSSLAKPHEGPADRYLHPILSHRITRLLLDTPISPNQVTVLSALVGLAAAFALVPGSWAWVALGGCMIELQAVLDSVDGELARARYQFSKFGQWLDTLSDGVLDITFGVCAGIAAGGSWVTVGAIAAAVRVFPEVYVYIDVYRKTGTPDQTRFRMWYQPDDMASEDVFDRRSLVSWVRTLGRRESYVVAYWLLCVANLPSVVVVYSAIIAALGAGGILVHMIMKRVAPRRPDAVG